MKAPTLYLAPLQGLTDQSFRKVYHRYFRGFDKLFTPYFAFQDSNPIRINKLRRALEDGYPKEQIVPQILSSSANAILRFSQSLEKLGYRELNLNLGCPYRIVTRKNKGAGMLDKPELIDQLLNEVFEKISLPVSVKIRLGHHHPDEVYKVIEVFNRYPLTEIIIHPRIGMQYYEGEPDQQRFAECSTLSKKTVVYNGDIFSAKDFQTIRQRHSDVRTFMLGRGVLRNPFLVMELKGLPVPMDKKATLYKFQQELFAAMLENRGKGKYFPQGIKEFWSYWCLSFEASEKIFDRIKRVESAEAYHLAVDTIFSEHELTK